MPMVSMKTDDSMCEPCSPNPYGYGLCLDLNDDQCEALGIKTPLAAGTVVMVQARAVVTRVTESTEADGDDTGNDISMSLQVTDMSLAPMEAARDSGQIAKTMYPGMS